MILANESLNPSAPEQPLAIAGAAVRSRRVSDFTAAEVVQARNECATREAFVARLGITNRRVWFWLKKFGLKKYPSKRRRDPALLGKALELHRGGMPWKHIARALNVGQTTIYDARVAGGQYVGPKQRPDADIIAARNECATRQECADRLGVSYKSVYYHLNRVGLPPYERLDFPVARMELRLAICAAFRAGKSMGVIEREFGLTRGQVAGNLARGGMFRTRSKPTVKLKPRPVIRRVRPPKFNAVPVRVQADPVVPLNISLLDLESHQCRWPYGTGPYTFCGHAKSDTHKSYCNHHAWMATNERRQRQRI